MKPTLLALLVVASGCTDVDDSRMRWSVTVSPSEDQPNLVDATARLYIPSEEVSGAVVFSRHGLGYEMFEHERWRQAAADDGYALIEVDIVADDGKDTAVDYPDQAGLMVEDLLRAAARESGHRELHDAPLVVWGHSSGSQMIVPAAAHTSAHIAGFIAFHGSVRQAALDPELDTREVLLAPEFLDVPGLVMVAEHDPVGLRDASIDFVGEGRDRGAHWALTVDEGLQHWGYDGTLDLMIPFAALAFEPPVDEPVVRLLNGPSFLSGIEDHWLPNQDFAALWSDYHASYEARYPATESDLVLLP